MYEVELKAKLNNREEVLSFLMLLNPTKIENVLCDDTYFDSFNNELFKSERELRVRRISKADNEENRIILTYKGEPFDETSKSKPEYEVHVGDHKNILAILKLLGYHIDIEFSKQCLNLNFIFKNQNMLASLVKIPELDLDFIEVETIVNNKNKIDSSMENLYFLFEYLRINEGEITNRYYTELIREFRNKF